MMTLPRRRHKRLVLPRCMAARRRVR